MGFAVACLTRTIPIVAENRSVKIKDEPQTVFDMGSTPMELFTMLYRVSAPIKVF